jgi:hypothetical protein
METEKIIPGATVNLYSGKKANKKLYNVKAQSFESNLLPINEFAKMNDDFRKFKDKRLQSNMSSSKDSDPVKASIDSAVTRNLISSSQLYNTNPNQSLNRYYINKSEYFGLVINSYRQY